MTDTILVCDKLLIVRHMQTNVWPCFLLDCTFLSLIWMMFVYGYTWMFVLVKQLTETGKMFLVYFACTKFITISNLNDSNWLLSTYFCCSRLEFLNNCNEQRRKCQMEESVSIVVHFHHFLLISILDIYFISDGISMWKISRWFVKVLFVQINRSNYRDITPSFQIRMLASTILTNLVANLHKIPLKRIKLYSSWIYIWVLFIGDVTF